MSKPADRTTEGRQPALAPGYRLMEERQGRGGLFAAVLLAFMLHLLLYWATPGEVFTEAPPQILVPQSMELVMEPIPEAPELDEMYVRAAPGVEEQVPEETRNISDRNQRAAQEQQSEPGPDNTPYVEGDEAESNRLVQGNPFQEPTPPSPPAASVSAGASPMVQQDPAPQKEQAQPAPDFLEQEPEEGEGLAAIEVPATAAEKPEEPVEAREEVVQTSPADGTGQARMATPPQAQEAPTPTPRPRLRVERDTSFGPIKDNRQGVIQIGRLAFDAEYSEFGEYWRRVAEIIEARWRNLVYNTRSVPFGGYRVLVEFNITREGRVTDVTVSYSSAGRLAETISVDAITGEAPFFPWTPEMIVRMGDKARCGIHFIY